MHPQMTAEEAVEELFHLYADDIYRYARYTLQNAADAKDAVQEVFMRAFRAWTDFRGEAGVKTWLFTIARNYIYDCTRKKQTERKYLQRHQADLRDVSVPIETFIELEDAVAQLKLPYRQVFALRCIEEFSTEETAVTLGWTQAKVKTTLHRALKELRNILNEDPKPMMGKEGEFNEARRNGK